MIIHHFFENLGEKTISFFIIIHEVWILLVKSFKSLFSLWFYRFQVVEQIYSQSAKSLGVVLVASLFLGMASMIQGKYLSSPFVPRANTIEVIFKTTIIEICPVLLALILAGKLSASSAAEIGSMKISEQIDALEMMSLDPVGFLVMPRILAGFLVLPVLTIIADFLAIFTIFFLSSIASNWISYHEFFRGLQIGFRSRELYLGCLIKPAVYGIIIGLMGAYFGLKAKGGAKGVGEASTKAVVISAILIVISDYYLAKIIL